MKVFIFILICFTWSVSGWGSFHHMGWIHNPEEYDPKMHSHSGKEISDQEMKSFRFPKSRGYKEGMYKMQCSEYKEYSDRMDTCHASRWFSRPTKCKGEFCDIEINEGYTDCWEDVTLNATYFRRGIQCKGQDQECMVSKSSSKSKGKMTKTCECQTIWCIEDIYTVYEYKGKWYRGMVTVKFPCKCECRKMMKMPKKEEEKMEESSGDDGYE